MLRLCLAGALIFSAAAKTPAISAPSEPFGDWIGTEPGSSGLVQAAYGNGVYVASGFEWVVSTNLADWAKIPDVSKIGISRVVFGNGVFIGVGGDTTRAVSAISTNGVDWAIAESPLSDLAAPIDFVAAGNGVFVARAGSQIFSSSNGVAWERRSVELAGGSQSVSFANGKFFVFGWGEISTSADGVNWSAPIRVDPKGRRLYTVAFGGGRYVIGGYSGLWSSADGASWESHPIGSLSSVVYGNGMFFGSGYDLADERGETVYFTSTDGQAWVKRPAHYPNTRWLIFGDGTFAVASHITGSVASSADGMTWTTRRDLLFTDLQDIAQGENELVAVGRQRVADGAILTPLVLRSTNGISWARHEVTEPGYLDAVAYGGGKYVALGYNSWNTGRFLTESSDGISWVTRYSDISLRLRDIVYGEGRWVAAGEGGSIVTSTNGVDWTPLVVSGAGARDFMAVTHGNGMFVAVGGSMRDFLTSVIYSSADGVNWTRRPVEGHILRGVTFGGGKFFATRWHGPCLVSDDGVNWKPLGRREEGGINDQPLGRASYAGGWFIAHTGDTTDSSGFGHSWVSGDFLTWTLVAMPLGSHVLRDGMVINATDTQVWRAPLTRRPALVEITPNRFSAEDGSMAGSFTLHRTGSYLLELEVGLEVSGSASAGVDYEALPASVVIPANAGHVTLPLRVLPDSAAEADESVTVSLRAQEDTYGIMKGPATLLIKETTDVPVFQPDQIAVEQSGAVQLKAYLPATGSYVVDVSQDLKTWTELQPIAPGNNPATIRDEAAGQGGQRYYRIRLAAP